MAKYADYTNKIIQKLPYWFSMKKDPYESIGVKFLNAFGLELEDMRNILEYAYEQTRIDNLDTDYLNSTYKAILPSNITKEDILSVSTNHYILKEVYDLESFYNITYNKKDIVTYDENVFYYDIKRRIIFLKRKYDECNHYKDGKITIKTSNEEIELPTTYHFVWNFLDEIGTLLNCYRIEKEPNINYKERILDVFKNPANSSKDGFLNGLARELSLRRNLIWQDCSKDLVLNDQMIILNKIQVNNVYVDINDVFINEYNKVVLKGDNELEGVSKEVSYVYGIELHEMFNKDDKKLNYEFFYSDGKPKELLIKYVRKMHEDMPIIWGKFRWDNSYWDITDKELGGVAYIPNNYDSSIKGFEKYISRGGE